jgi:SsrA-binding protein
LLLKKIEIKRLLSEVEQKKVSVVPLKAYFKKGRLKILIGIGKGKKKFDKREDLKRRDLDREIQRKTKV